MSNEKFMQEIHPDRESYDYIWTHIIEAEIDAYKKIYTGFIELIPCAKEEIWEKYTELNRYCKINYMEISNEKIDRHKVAACYMYAILLAAPVKFVKIIDGRRPPLALNERLAITVGLSLVCAFFITSVSKTGDLNKDKDKFKNGVRIPDEKYVNHGVYIENFANELHFSMLEGNISILALAHELYLLEVITRMHFDENVKE